MIGISIDVSEPRLKGAAPLETLADIVTGYDHASEVFGGFKSANFSLTGPLGYLEDWYENGLMREVTTRDEAGAVVWQGFVNAVALTIGGRSVERGPVLDIVNHLRMLYTTINTTVTPAPVAAGEKPAFTNQLDSQALYGIMGGVYSTSNVDAASAAATVANIVATFLEENAWPETTETLSLEGGVASVTVKCAGYGEILKKAVYNSAATGTGALSDKILAVLNAEPNGWLAVNARSIASNTILVPLLENNDRMGLDVIKGLVALGDVAYNRYTFGVYENREPVYAPAPTTYAYEYSLAESLLSVYHGDVVNPWNVRPGQWLFYPDFLPGSASGAKLRRDPRSVFIESVNFTAPYGISINGGKVRRLPQILAQLGLGGGAA
jgi:hypothetical protein